MTIKVLIALGILSFLASGGYFIMLSRVGAMRDREEKRAIAEMEEN